MLCYFYVFIHFKITEREKDKTINKVHNVLKMNEKYNIKSICHYNKELQFYIIQV